MKHSKDSDRFVNGEETESSAKRIIPAIRFEKIIQGYMNLSKIPDNGFQGNCPFRFSGERKLYIPRFGPYVCQDCGARGSRYRLLRKAEMALEERSKYWYQNLTHFHSDMKGMVYILELENGNYYVGFSLEPVKRLSAHFNGMGAKWTRKHKPKRILQLIADAPMWLESDLTRQMRERFGAAVVRGGGHSRA